MAWSGGNFTRANGDNGWVNDAGSGIGIEAGLHDNQDNDFKNGINECLNKTGQNQMTGNLNLGGYIATNAASGTAAAPAICAGNDQDTGLFSPAANQIGIATNGTEKIRIDASGNVGIGTTAPADKLEVATTGFYPQYWTSYTGASAGGTNLMIRKSRGATVGTNTIVANNDIIGSIDFAGANGTTFSSCANIAVAIDGTPGASNDMPGRLLFSTTPDGSGTPTERMRISANGNVGIGNTSTGTSRLSLIASGAGATNMIVDCYNSAPSRQFAVREDGNIIIPTVYFIGSGAAANVVIDASGFLYRSTSSLKYKENIQPLPYGLSDVLQLNPVTFSSKNENEHGLRFAGLIAEEVDAVGLNEFVQYAPDGSPDALHYGNMVSLAVKAIQELNAKVEALEARVMALEA